MMHPSMFPKATTKVGVKPDKVNDDVKPDKVNDDVKLNDVKSGARPVVVEVDVREQFINK